MNSLKTKKETKEIIKFIKETIKNLKKEQRELIKEKSWMFVTFLAGAIEGVESLLEEIKAKWD